MHVYMCVTQRALACTKGTFPSFTVLTELGPPLWMPTDVAVM